MIGGAERSREFVETHYATLRAMARSRRRRAAHTDGLLTTDILHDAWLKLARRDDWNDEAHFLSAAAHAMRSVIVDNARSLLTAKRGGGVAHLAYGDLADILSDPSEAPEDVVVINDLIENLKLAQPRVAQVVVLRYFGGFNDAEAALLLGVSDRTVRNDWRFARAWIAGHLRPADPCETRIS